MSIADDCHQRHPRRWRTIFHEECERDCFEWSSSREWQSSSWDWKHQVEHYSTKDTILLGKNLSIAGNVFSFKGSFPCTAGYPGTPWHLSDEDLLHIHPAFLLGKKRQTSARLPTGKDWCHQKGLQINFTFGISPFSNMLASPSTDDFEAKHPLTQFLSKI